MFYCVFLLQILVYPPSLHVSFSNIFMFVVNKTTNDMIGYTITDNSLTGSEDISSSYYILDSPAQLLWRIHIPNDQEIIEVKSHHTFGNNILCTIITNFIIILVT